MDILLDEIKREVAGLKIRPRILAEGRISGIHPSSHHGQSREFSDLKGYTFGDDIKDIDWKVFARSDKLYVRRYYDETNLSAWLVIDCSGSMSYPYGRSKFMYAGSMLSIFAFLLLRQRDEVGLALSKEEGSEIWPQRGMPSYFRDIQRIISHTTPSGKTRLSDTIKDVYQLMKKRGMFILASDLITDLDQCLKLLQQISSLGHCVVLLHILSHEELTFPLTGSVVFTFIEEQDTMLLDAKRIRKYYLDALEKYLRQIIKTCHESKIYYFQLDTSVPPQRYIRDIVRQLESR